MTARHLDEYKATGTQSWELAVRDEHGRLRFSLRLKKRDSWPIQAILRGFRMLGWQSKLFYVDFWLAYPPAIKAIYPDAAIQYDFFHVIQNIHRPLYKALTPYRNAFKAVQSEQEPAELRQPLPKKLGQHRYLLFTHEENLSPDQRQILDHLLDEHPDTSVEHSVLFRQQVRTLFNESDTFSVALENLAVLILDGWADWADAFGKVMTFLQNNFENMLTSLRLPNVPRYALSDCTVPSLRRIEKVRQGFKSHRGRVNQLKLLPWRKYLRPVS